ncbi:hypothetical protein [Bulleidia sp. zg-1006]|uniref:hypothetical protein n=1 Tax=Bulleidia sp. zg-1006 TaxID=2806552 RepID=UPI001939BFB9|nr:hypothetical protein [Bulleidia sp. zg-1006]QRG86397.1 hypothetical protein JOS54_05955 [Bulleidia sp. zg-1006]
MIKIQKETKGFKFEIAGKPINLAFETLAMLLALCTEPELKVALNMIIVNPKKLCRKEMLPSVEKLMPIIKAIALCEIDPEKSDIKHE